MNYILNLRKAGATYQEIADTIGTSRQYIQSVIKEKAPDLCKIQSLSKAAAQVIKDQAALEKAKKKAAKEALKEKVVKLAKQGKPQSEIGELVGLPQNVVSNICVERGIRRLNRRPGRLSGEDVLSLVKMAGVLRAEGKSWIDIGKLLKVPPEYIAQAFSRLKSQYNDEIMGDVRERREKSKAEKLHKRVQKLKSQGFSLNKVAEKLDIKWTTVKYYYDRPYFERQK